MKHVSVAIIKRQNSSREDEYLFVSSKKDMGEFTRSYYPPGGHVEEGETSVEAVVRELREELALDILPTKLIASTPGDVPDSLVDWWECNLPVQEFSISEDVIGDARFLSRADCANVRLWPATEKFFNQYIWS